MAGFGLAALLSAQRTVRIGVGVVPALNRTIDLGVEIGDGKTWSFLGRLGICRRIISEWTTNPVVVGSVIVPTTKVVVF